MSFKRSQNFGLPPEDLYKRGFVFYQGYGGYGATNTCIPYSSATNVKQGGSSLITQNSTTYGLSTRITQQGIYVISFTFGGQTTGGSATEEFIGISLNSVNLSTSVISIPVTELLDVSEVVVPSSSSASCRRAFYCGPLEINDVVRPHGDTVVSTRTPMFIWSVCQIL